MFRLSHRPVVLSLLLGTALEAQAPPSRPTENLEPNRQTVRLIWGTGVSFVFAGHAGQVITLRVNSKSPGLDPHVCLFDPEDRIEAFDDDSGKRGNSLIKDHTLKQDGQYTIVVGVEDKILGKVEIWLEGASSSSRTAARGPAMTASSSQLSCTAGSPNLP